MEWIQKSLRKEELSMHYILEAINLFQKMFVLLYRCLAVVLLTRFVSCAHSHSSSSGNHTVHSLYGPTQFMKHAQSLPVVSDKTQTHGYHEMYGLFLLPLIQRKHRVKEKVKFFEIGLGCNFNASSVGLWKSLLNSRDEIWMAELSHRCIENYKASGQLDGINVVEGDQGEVGTIKEWAKIIGPNIDVIVDDGSHQNHAISNTFHGLWESLAPGGLYFVEDMVLLNHSYKDKYGSFFLDYIASWNRQLALWGSFQGKESLDEPFPLPHRLKWVFCQAEACVFAKCSLEDTSICAD